MILVGLIGLALLGCADGGEAVTVYEGSVRQRVFGPWTVSDPRPMRFVFVVDIEHEDSEVATRARAGADRAMRRLVKDLLRLNGARRVPVDARASIVVARQYEVVDARDDPRLVWTQDRMTLEGANRFVEGVVSAVARPSSGPPPVGDLAALILAQALLPPTETETTFYVLITDRTVTERQLWELAGHAPRAITAVISGSAPSACDEYGEDDRVPSVSDCPYIPPNDSVSCGGWVVGEGKGKPRCRVRAFRADPAACWQPAAGLVGWSDRPMLFSPSLVGADEHPMFGCLVAELTGDDRRRCEAGETCEGCASGFCIASTGRREHPFHSLRFVGLAPPSGATLEVVCETPRAP